MKLIRLLLLAFAAIQFQSLPALKAHDAQSAGRSPDRPIRQPRSSTFTRVGHPHPLDDRLPLAGRYQGERKSCALYAGGDARAAGSQQHSSEKCHVKVVSAAAAHRKARRNASGRITHAGFALSAQSLRRSRRAIQRDVRLGQLLHPAGTRGRPPRSRWPKEWWITSSSRSSTTAPC